MAPSRRRAVTRFFEFSSARRERHEAGRAAVVVARRPVVLEPPRAAADRRQRHRRVPDERVRLQALGERGEVGQRLQRRAGLAVGLRRAVELAQRVGEAARHGEDAPALVLEHERRALHGRAHAQLGADASLAALAPPLGVDFSLATRTRTTSCRLRARRIAALQALSGTMRPSARPTRTTSPSRVFALSTTTAAGQCTS